MEKVRAYRYSQEVDGKRLQKDEVELLDQNTENGVTTYIVKTYDGITCTAIFNPFSNTYYVDDVYGVVESPHKKNDMEM